VPIVVTGFEPLDIIEGVYLCVRQLEAGRAEIENQYSRSVKRAGNLPAQAIMREVFQVVRRRWRGIGEIEESGLALSDAYRAFDAEERFGAVGARCTPEHPLGVTMVSSEGACAAYYRYRRTPAAAQ